MNYFVEGLQGSGKSTLVGNLSEKYPDHLVYREGDYSPTELAWCAYVTIPEYEKILERYPSLASEIEEKSVPEEDHRIICYTRILTDVPGFHKDLEQYEIYNGRISYEEFRRIIRERYEKWQGENEIFECSLFQNIIEDMILFRCASDEEILDFYRELREVLSKKDFRILYLEAEDVAANIDVIRKERSDDQGNELWFPLMLGYFDESPYAKEKGLSGADALLDHLRHRQSLELRICRELFPDRVTVLPSKGYGEL